MVTDVKSLNLLHVKYSVFNLCRKDVEDWVMEKLKVFVV